jgi:hypothetical protein
VIADPRSGRELRFDTALLSLRSREVRVRAGDSISTLLRSSGIVPDGEAFAAFYRLNPELSTARVDRETRLLVPVVSGPQSLQRALEAGNVAFITIDLSQKLRYVQSARSLSKLVDGLDSLSSAQFGDSAGKYRLIHEAARISDNAHSIGLALQGRSRPVDSTLMSVLVDEVELANSILAKVHAQETAPTEQQHEVLRAIGQDLAVRARYWTETLGHAAAAMVRISKVPVEIRTVSREGSEVKGLRVYWVEDALRTKRSPTPFLTPSSPIADRLYVGDYVMWATALGDSAGRPLSEVLGNIQVRQKCLATAAAPTPSSATCVQPITLTVLRKP